RDFGHRLIACSAKFQLLEEALISKRKRTASSLSCVDGWVEQPRRYCTAFKHGSDAGPSCRNIHVLGNLFYEGSDVIAGIIDQAHSECLSSSNCLDTLVSRKFVRRC